MNDAINDSWEGVRTYKDTDFLNPIESDSYLHMLSLDLQDLRKYLKTNPEQTDAINSAIEKLLPLQSLARFRFSDCKIMDEVYDKMAALGLSLDRSEKD